MCILQGKIVRVNGTRIFVAPTKDEQQITVYTNQVEQKNTEDASTASPTPAMILPVFSKSKGDDVKLIDLSKYKDVFTDLEELFQRSLRENENALGKSGSKGAAGSLQVFRVGSYDISIVPTREDFDRLQQDVFKLDENVAKLFAQKYSDKFSFVVCKLVDSADYHPVAYLSTRLESGALFVPTYHYHGKANEKPDWDHTIYVAYNQCVPVDDNDTDLKGGLRRQIGSKYVEDLKSLLEAKLKEVTFDWDNITNISKTNIDRSYSKNHDIHVTA